MLTFTLFLIACSAVVHGQVPLDAFARSYGYLTGSDWNDTRCDQNYCPIRSFLIDHLTYAAAGTLVLPGLMIYCDSPANAIYFILLSAKKGEVKINGNFGVFLNVSTSSGGSIVRREVFKKDFDTVYCEQKFTVVWGEAFGIGPSSMWWNGSMPRLPLVLLLVVVTVLAVAAAAVFRLKRTNRGAPVSAGQKAMPL